MDDAQREAILANPLDTLTLPGYARGQLRKENDQRRNRSEEDQAVYEMRPIMTVGDWLSLGHSDRSSFGSRTFASIENACEALGVRRADVEKADRDRFWAEQEVKAKFERWCWAHEPLIRHLEENPALVAELEARIQLVAHH